jgi:hypothetical protein
VARSRSRFEPLADWPGVDRIELTTDAPGWRAELPRLVERMDLRRP